MSKNTSWYLPYQCTASHRAWLQSTRASGGQQLPLHAALHLDTTVSEWYCVIEAALRELPALKTWTLERTVGVSGLRLVPTPERVHMYCSDEVWDLVRSPVSSPPLSEGHRSVPPASLIQALERATYGPLCSLLCIYFPRLLEFTLLHPTLHWEPSLSVVLPNADLIVLHTYQASHTVTPCHFFVALSSPVSEFALDIQLLLERTVLYWAQARLDVASAPPSPAQTALVSRLHPCTWQTVRMLVDAAVPPRTKKRSTHEPRQLMMEDPYTVLLHAASERIYRDLHQQAAIPLVSQPPTAVDNGGDQRPLFEPVPVCERACQTEDCIITTATQGSQTWGTHESQTASPVSSPPSPSVTASNVPHTRLTEDAWDVSFTALLNEALFSPEGTRQSLEQHFRLTHRGLSSKVDSPVTSPPPPYRPEQRTFYTQTEAVVAPSSTTHPIVIVDDTPLSPTGPKVTAGRVRRAAVVGKSALPRMLDIRPLTDTQWLDDTHVNFYLQQLLSEIYLRRPPSDDPDVPSYHLLDSLHARRIVTSNTPPLRKSLFTQSAHGVLVPVHDNHHWYLLHFDSSGCYIYDSLRSPYRTYEPVVRKLHAYFRTHHAPGEWPAMDEYQRVEVCI